MPVHPRRLPFGVRAFTALLVLYPAEFRDEYGRELSLVFADRYRHARGPLDRVGLWSEALAGLLTEALKEHADTTAHDLRYTVRRLRHSPGFATVSIASLALAIGASTAMFAVLDAAVLRPLPYPSAGRLMMVWSESPATGRLETRTAFADVEQWREQSQHFAGLEVFDPVSVSLRRGDETEQISGVMASPDVLTLLGVTPAEGRGFMPSDATARRRVALISSRFRDAHFGRGRPAVGLTIDLDGEPSEIVGVLPAALPGFDADVWQPHTIFPDWERRRTQRGAGAWFVLGRLEPAVTIAQAQAEMDAIARRLAMQLPPAARSSGISLQPLDHYVTGSRPRLVVWLMAAASLCLLLVAAANIAGLSLARSVGRASELALRTALGASRPRIVRQLLVESLTLAAIAAVIGGGLALLAIQTIRGYAPATLPRLQDVSLDARVLAWTIATSVATGILIGLAPVWALRRYDLRPAAGSGRGVVGGTAVPLRRVLVVAQCAVAILLLSGAGLLLRSWWNVMHVDLGFRPERALALSVATPPTIPAGQRAALYERLVEEAQALPGVAHAGVSSELFVGSVADQTVTLEGADGRMISRLPVRSDEVSEGFFDAVGTPLRRGRRLTAADGPRAPLVALVNEAMAARLWPGQDAVGQRFTVGAAGPEPAWMTVVGVVADMRRQSLEAEPVPQMFQPLAQNPPRRAILFVRSSVTDPATVVAPLRSAVTRAIPGASAYHITTLEARLEAFTAQRRLQTSMLIACSVMALLLTAIGLYGLIHYSVASRTQEIGIRMALGARPGDISRAVLGEGLALSVAGLAIGLTGTAWVGQATSSLLFGVEPTDPATLAGVAGLLLAVAGAACYVPARAAVRISPLGALQRRPR
ncbi:MAG: ABC transporter permease [Vicinamibacterales bacterium]